MIVAENLVLRSRAIHDIASDGERLSPLARVHHAHSWAAERITLPPMPIGATFLERWPLREGPGHATWRADHYDSMAPAIFVVRDAVVHSSAGLIGVDRDVVAETLAHTEPAMQAFRRTDEGIFLQPAKVGHLAGTHITLLAGAPRNYFHVVMEGIMRLAMLTAPMLHEAETILYSAGGVGHEAMLRLMNLPDTLNLRPVHDSETLRVDKLIYPLSIHGLAQYHPCLCALFDQISSNVSSDYSTLPKRFYVDRRRSTNRVLLNETEVIDALRDMDVVPVSLEMMSIEDQVRLFRSAELVVGPHGAGLTNLGFCKPRCAVLELQMDGYASWHFRHVAALRNLAYDCVLGRATTGPTNPLTTVHGLCWVISAQHVAAAARQMTRAGQS